MELLQLAHDLILQFEATEYPPHGFLNLLCRYSPDAGSDGFCLYGFVTALYIRARHLMESDDPDMRKMAQNDLQYASVCLGKELSVDFLDSSGWPTSSLELYLNVNQSTFMLMDE